MESERVKLAQPEFEEAEIQAVVQVLRSGSLVQGEQVAAFERGVATYLGAKEAVACANGTAALHLAWLALGLGPGDEVIVPDYAFPSAANMVEAVGARTVPVDISLETFNIDVEGVSRALSPRTKAIMPVHLFGLCADLVPLKRLAEQAGVPLVEDAACALGATWPEPGPSGSMVSRQTGALGAMACYSFHPRKVVTTAEGGLVVTNDDRLARRLRRMRNHGATPLEGRMVFHDIGFNYRMTELQGALGVVQLQRLEGYIAQRRRLAAEYDRRLEGLPVSRPAVPPGFGHVYQSYVVLLPDQVRRDEVIVRLREQHIESTIGTYALHQQPYYRDRYGLTPDQLPQSAAAMRRTLALPLHQRMQEADVQRVVTALEAILPGCGAR